MKNLFTFILMSLVCAGCASQAAPTARATGLGMPPVPPAVAPQAQTIQPVVIWTPLALTLEWDGCDLPNALDTVAETNVLPPRWVPLATLVCTNGPMSYPISAAEPMGFFQIERAIQP